MESLRLQSENLAPLERPFAARGALEMLGHVDKVHDDDLSTGGHLCCGPLTCGLVPLIRLLSQHRCRWVEGLEASTHAELPHDTPRCSCLRDRCQRHNRRRHSRGRRQVHCPAFEGIHGKPRKLLTSRAAGKRDDNFREPALEFLPEDAAEGIAHVSRSISKHPATCIRDHQAIRLSTVRGSCQDSPPLFPQLLDVSFQLRVAIHRCVAHPIIAIRHGD
mmetsp:Transcript_102080/g.286974  ORF Transcript_102080/g.286974 Transcript_102080/m.286974 type:complete len:219 (+) Transcript_102080:299-955(+)